MPGERGGGVEAADASALTDDLGRGKRPAAGQCEKAGREHGDEALDLPLELADRGARGADASEQRAGDPCDRARNPGERPGERVLGADAVERAAPRLLDPQLVEVPAQAGDVAGALGDQVVAVVDEQAHVALGAVERGDRQVRVREGRAGDRERIDRVALARLAHRATEPRHELGRHAHDRLARAEQVGLQTPREVAAVLEPPAVRPAYPRSPGAQLEVAVRCGGHRPLAELAALLVDRDDRVPALVQIRSQDDHVRVASVYGVTHGPVGGHT